MELGLAGKRFLVTGGTRGIGRPSSRACWPKGADVAFCARSADAVAEAQAELSTDGSIAFGTAVDVRDAAALNDWVAHSAESLGSIDGVVANVSALSDDWRSSIEVDLMGTISLIDAALPHLLASGAGSIVTISSVSGREIDVFAGSYGTIKAAIIHYTQGWLISWLARGCEPTPSVRATPTFPAGCGRP